MMRDSLDMLKAVEYGHVQWLQVHVQVQQQRRQRQQLLPRPQA